MKKTITLLSGILVATATMAFTGPSSYARSFASAFAQNSDGSLQKLSYQSAVEFCNSMGLNLPTARQWAQYAVERGATGLSTHKLPGYDPVYKDAKQILFYFNPSGFQSEQSEIFWTSEPLWGGAMGISFHSARAQFWSWTNLTSSLAVRCISAVPVEPFYEERPFHL